jgi:hypothetical protein
MDALGGIEERKPTYSPPTDLTTEFRLALDAPRPLPTSVSRGDNCSVGSDGTPSRRGPEFYCASFGFDQIICSNMDKYLKS